MKKNVLQESVADSPAGMLGALGTAQSLLDAAHKEHE